MERIVLPKAVKTVYRRLTGRRTDADVIKRSFDRAWYLQQNSDVARLGLNPIDHFLNHGWFEGRWPRPDFDPSWYRDAYPDVAASGENPFVHFVREGRSQGRKTVGDMGETKRSAPLGQVPEGSATAMFFEHRLATATGRVQVRLTRAFASRAV